MLINTAVPHLSMVPGHMYVASEGSFIENIAENVSLVGDSLYTRRGEMFALCKENGSFLVVAETAEYALHLLERESQFVLGYGIKAHSHWNGVPVANVRPARHYPSRFSWATKFVSIPEVGVALEGGMRPFIKELSFNEIGRRVFRRLRNAGACDLLEASVRTLYVNESDQWAEVLGILLEGHKRLIDMANCTDDIVRLMYWASTPNFWKPDVGLDYITGIKNFVVDEDYIPV